MCIRIFVRMQGTFCITIRIRIILTQNFAEAISIYQYHIKQAIFCISIASHLISKSIALSHWLEIIKIAAL